MKRVLKKSGTCFVNLGDSYHNATKWTNKEKLPQTISSGNNRDFKTGRKLNQGLPEKSLCLIPFRFAIEMQNRGWTVRNVIVWHKSNAMPSSVRDRFTVDFEYVFFFVKSRKYYFERQYEPHLWAEKDYRSKRHWRENLAKSGKMTKLRYSMKGVSYGSLGRNKRTVWTIPTRAFKNAHFAVYPETLCETPIKAGCPQFICNKCHMPREKIFEGTSTQAFNIRVRDVAKNRIKHTDRAATQEEVANYHENYGKGKRFVGYTDCGCNAGFKPGIVLDPFMGAGTTAVVARRLQRDYLGIELSEDYIKIAQKRLAQMSIWDEK